MRVIVFINKGTDCYINATLQGLFTEYKFINYLYKYRHEIMKFDISSLQGRTDYVKQNIGARLVKSIAIVVYKLYDPNVDITMCHKKQLQPFSSVLRSPTHITINTDGDDEIIPVYMEDLRKVIINSFGDNYSAFIGQKDAHEFLKKLLEFLNQGFIAMGLLLDPTCGFTIINQLFWGSTSTYITSTECKHSSQTHVKSDYFDLVVPINLDIYKEKQQRLPEGTDVQTYVNEFFAEEELDDKNKWMCPTCKIERKIKKGTIMVQTPEILTVTLSRFKFDTSGSKIQKKVKINNTIHVSTKTGKVKYELKSMIIHKGLSLLYGHYIAVVKHFNGKWYQCDDDVPSIEKNIDIKAGHENKDAYILFYKKT